MQSIVSTLLILISVTVFSQRDFDDLTNEACHCITRIDTNKSATKRQQKATRCIESAYSDFSDVLADEMESYLSINPQATDLALGQFIQRKISSAMIDNCDPFFDILMERTISKPQFENIPVNSYMKSLAPSMCQCINENESPNQKVVDDCIVPFFDTSSEEFKKAIAKDPAFIEHTTFYLIKTCKSFARISIKNGTLR